MSGPKKLKLTVKSPSKSAAKKSAPRTKKPKPPESEFMGRFRAGASSSKKATTDQEGRDQTNVSDYDSTPMMRVSQSPRTAKSFQNAASSSKTPRKRKRAQKDSAAPAQQKKARKPAEPKKQSPSRIRAPAKKSKTPPSAASSDTASVDRSISESQNEHGAGSPARDYAYDSDSDDTLIEPPNAPVSPSRPAWEPVESTFVDNHSGIKFRFDQEMIDAAYALLKLSRGEEMYHRERTVIG